MQNFPKQIEDLQAYYDRRVRETLADVDRTEQYKAKLIASVYDETREKAQNLLDDERDRLEVEVRAARRAAFAPNLEGSKDAAAVWAYYRQCLDRAEKLTTVNEVREALASSEMIGDDLMSKALLHRAYFLGDGKSVETYLAPRPEEKRAWDEFMDKAEEYNEFEKQQVLFGLSRFRKPEELLPRQYQA